MDYFNFLLLEFPLLALNNPGLGRSRVQSSCMKRASCTNIESPAPSAQPNHQRPLRMLSGKFLFLPELACVISEKVWGRCQT